MPRASLKTELMERAIADDVAASALGSLRDVRFWTDSAEDVGVGDGVSADGFDLWKKGITMVDVRINSIIGLTSRPALIAVAT